MNHHLQPVHGSSGGQDSSSSQSPFALTSLAMDCVMHLIHVNAVELLRRIAFRQKYRLRQVLNYE
jgi:hypothetical protein